jgi:polyisoprenoid-binding protein YceI
MNVLLVIIFSFVSTSAIAAGPCIVPGRGHFNIRTGTGGLFGGFAHEHLIEARKIEGCADINSQDLTRSSIKLTFSTADIRVTDPNENPETRAKVQKTMETEVLKVASFPQVIFESTGIERDAEASSVRVRGNLTIRGKSLPIVVPVTLARQDDGSYRATGTYKLKQTSFGIQPIRLAGGTVKVKDEVTTEFELFLK